MDFVQNTCHIDFHIFLCYCKTILGCKSLQQALVNSSVQNKNSVLKSWNWTLRKREFVTFSKIRCRKAWNPSLMTKNWKTLQYSWSHSKGKKWASQIEEYTKTRVYKTSFELKKKKKKKWGKSCYEFYNKPTGHWALLEIISVAMQPRCRKSI